VKGVVIDAPSILKIKELSSRPLKEFEVRIEVACAAVCGSDLKNIINPVVVPQIPGHEFSGNVIEITSISSAYVSVGDRVTAFPMITCLECESCINDEYRNCTNKQSLGFQLPGAFAEEIIVDSRFLIPLKDKLTYEEGALVEHLCCGYRLMKELEAKSTPEDRNSIVIIGDGPIALADLQALKMRGYTNITLIGKHQVRMDLAYQLGANRVIDVQQYFGGECQIENIDICIYVANAEDTLEKIIPSINSGGIFFPQTRVINKRILKKIEDAKLTEGRAFAYLFNDFNTVMELIEKRILKTDSLVSSRITLDDLIDYDSVINNKEHNNKVMVVNNILRVN